MTKCLRGIRRDGPFRPPQHYVLDGPVDIRTEWGLEIRVLLDLGEPLLQTCWDRAELLLLDSHGSIPAELTRVEETEPIPDSVWVEGSPRVITVVVPPRGLGLNEVASLRVTLGEFAFGINSSIRWVTPGSSTESTTPPSGNDLSEVSDP